jgi:uncharacterized protein YbjT (DUF2867 family)
MTPLQRLKDVRGEAFRGRHEMRDDVRVLLFGATGMVGQGVLRECLLDANVNDVLSLGRRPTGQTHPKLRERAPPEGLDFSSIEAELKGFDACFFCLGVSSAGMKEADYRRVTFDLTLAVAGTLARLNPGMTFIYVSGSGTDSSEKGRSMWARVKGQTENALLRLPLKAVMFRPGAIEPLHGIQSRTRLYRVIYSLARPLWAPLRLAFPQSVTTTEQIGRAMLRVARVGAPKAVLETRDINAL